jgi:diguanylate cyclase (GGDEF)-like protein
MVPSKRKSEDDRTHSEPDQSGADRDQTYSDGDQTGSRERTAQARRTTSSDRLETASARDETAHKRDLSALDRDRAAEARDQEDDGHDAETDARTSSYEARRQPVDRSSLCAAHDRERAASDRARSAMHRVDAGGDRQRAGSDRELAAGDRQLAAQDRAHWAAEREADEIDMLTGARRRAPGLADIRREIDRARRGTGQLVAVYVDVDGLKATNDSKGHRAGDVMLKHVVGVMQASLRSYEQVVRMGGDEFVCTISDASIETVKKRFEQISANLRAAPEAASITVGFAQLAHGDSPMDLISRADNELIDARGTSDHGRNARS